jgi:hypothetical protein
MKSDCKTDLIERTEAEFKLFKQKVLKIQPLDTTQIVEPKSNEAIKLAQEDVENLDKA